jgi:inner membrane protein
MPTFLTHAVVGVALGQAAPAAARKDPRFWCAAAVCAMLPDCDVIGHRLGWHLGDVWDHRGFTHSLLFAAVTGIVAGYLVGKGRAERAKLMLLLAIITASHGVLDAMTNGGSGVAFFSPFSTARYFFPWRPIHVSPFGLHLDLAGRVLHALRSETLWVWPAALVLALAIHAARQWWDSQHVAPAR